MPSSVFTDTYQLLIAKLRTARLSAGLTQAQAAAKFGRHQSMISKLESGERRVDVIELAELASLYRISLDWVLSDVVKKYQPKAKKSKK
jgi:transcriptional regulator with XRE-family HTH domain